MLNIYSLSDYTVTFTFDKTNITGLKEVTLNVGGASEVGKTTGYIGKISVSREKDAWSTTTDVTGGFIHNRDLSKAGKVTLNINQLSDNVVKFGTIMNMIQNASSQDIAGGITISIAGPSGEVANVQNALPIKFPDRDFGEQAANFDWAFTAGIVDFTEQTTL